MRFEKPDGWLPKLFAYSDRPSLPRMTTPLAFSFFAMPESSSGKECAQRVVAVRRVHALHVDEVLQQDRQAVGGAAKRAGGALGVGARGFLQRVLVELRDGVEAGAALVQRLDPVDVRARELRRT